VSKKYGIDNKVSTRLDSKWNISLDMIIMMVAVMLDGTASAVKAMDVLHE